MTAPTMARLHDWLAGLTGDFVTKDEVSRFLATEKALHAADLDNLKDILVFNALVHAAVCDRTAGRYFARRSAVRGNVTAGAANLTAGSPSGLLDTRHVVDEKGTARIAAEMTGEDHLYVAGHYTDRSKRLGMFAAFHRAVAKRIGNNRTDCVFNASQYEALYRTFAPK